MENFIESLYVPYQNKATKAVIKDEIMIAVPMGTVSVPGLVTFNAEDFSVLGGKVFISSKRFDDKLDKVISAAATDRVYAVSSSGENYMQPFSATPGANRIPLRDSNGDVLVPAAPSSDNAAIGTTYADGRYVVKKPHMVGKTEVYIQTDDGISTKEAGDTAGDIPVRNANGNITGHSPLTDDEYTTRSFVNSSIANEAADYISNNGEPFTSLAELNEYTKTHTVTNNDYAIVVVTEDNGNTRYDRYKYNESTGVWGFEYSINNSSFTEAQWAAINSGLTSAKLSTMLREIDELMAQSLMSTDEIVAPYGESTVTYDTTDGITLHGALAVKTNDGNYWNIPLTFSLPLVVGDGLVADSTADNKKMTIKVDYEKTMALPALDQGNYQLALATGKWNSGTSSTKPPDAIQWRGVQKGIKPNEIVQRTETGNVLLPDSFPTSPNDDGKDAYGNIISRMSTPKGYVDANDWHVVDINENAIFTQEQYNIIEMYWPRVILRVSTNIESESYEYLPYLADEVSSDEKSFYFCVTSPAHIKRVVVSMRNGSVSDTWDTTDITTSSLTADSIVKRTDSGNINVPLVPAGTGSATSKTYVDKAVAAASGSKQVVVRVKTSAIFVGTVADTTINGTLDVDTLTAIQGDDVLVNFVFSNASGDDGVSVLFGRNKRKESSTTYLWFGDVIPVNSGTNGLPFSFAFRVTLADGKWSLNYAQVYKATDVDSKVSSATANMQKTTNLSTSIGDSPSDTKYPSDKAVADYVTDNAGTKIVDIVATYNDGTYTITDDYYTLLEANWPNTRLRIGSNSHTIYYPSVSDSLYSDANYKYAFFSMYYNSVNGYRGLTFNTAYIAYNGIKHYLVSNGKSLDDDASHASNSLIVIRNSSGQIFLPDQSTAIPTVDQAISRRYFEANQFMKLIDFSSLKNTENSQNLTMTITSDVFVDILNNLSNRYVKTGMVHGHEQIFSPDNDKEFCLFWPNCLTYDENDSSQTTDAVAHFVGGHNGKFYEVQVSGSSASMGVWTNTKATLVELNAYLDKPENTGTVGQVLTKTETGSRWVDSVTVQVVNIDSPATATNGTLTAAQLATLQASDQNYIMFNHEKYYLGDKGHQEGFLTYSHVGYENGSHFLKSITITISTLAWVLNTTECADKSDIPSGGSSISWHTEVPSDTSKVLMTKCTCTACPDYEQFVGMTTLVYGYIATTSYSALAWQKVVIDPNSAGAVVFLGKFGPSAELGQYLEGPKYLSWQNGANGPDYTENTVAYEYLY